MTSSICAIIPTYNRATLLRECLDSILIQSRPVDEIIVVNDGSTDDTENVITSYNNRIKLINKKNGGKSSALNIALRQCQSDYVWICDDDDIAAPGAIEHLAAPLDADKKAGFSFGTYQTFSSGDPERRLFNPLYWARDEEPNTTINFLEGMFTFQYAMLVRRSLYLEVGEFREEMIRSEDYDMVIRLSRHAKSIYVPKIIFFQRKHSGMRGSKSDSFKAEDSIRKWLKYDHDVFAWIRKEFRLEEFTPTFALQWENVLAKRAALIQRACVFAKRALWDAAIEDFRRASETSAVSATPQELRLAETVIQPSLPWQVLGRNPGWIAGLRDCYRANEYGRQIINSACRPLVWHARKTFQVGDIAGGFRILRSLVNILGIRGTSSRVLLSLQK